MSEIYFKYWKEHTRYLSEEQQGHYLDLFVEVIRNVHGIESALELSLLFLFDEEASRVSD